MVDREKALNLLVGRYRYEEAMCLFAEYCLLLEEDWSDYLARHSPHRLRQIHRQLGAVGLWPPELVPPPGGTGLFSEAKRAITGMLSTLRPAPAVPVEAGSSDLAGGEPDAFSREAALGGTPDLVLQSLVSAPLSIGLGPALLSDPVIAVGSTLHDHIGHVRYRVAQELGFAFPLVQLGEAPHLPGDRYQIRIFGETVAEGRLVPGCVAATGADIPAAWQTDPHPVTGDPIAWMASSAAGSWHGSTIEPPALLAEHLYAVISQNAHRLFGNVELEALLRTYEAEIGKDTISELFGRFMSLSELRLALQALLRQGHSLRGLPRMIDVLITHYIEYLAEKSLSMDETWKLSSHIPFFSTDELVRIICEGLGLPTGRDRLADVQASLERAMRLDVGPRPGAAAHGPGALEPIQPWRVDPVDRENRFPLDPEEGAR